LFSFVNTFLAKKSEILKIFFCLCSLASKRFVALAHFHHKIVRQFWQRAEDAIGNKYLAPHPTRKTPSALSFVAVSIRRSCAAK